MRDDDATITIRIADVGLRDEVATALSDYFKECPDAELLAALYGRRKAGDPTWFPDTYIRLNVATTVTAGVILEGVKLLLKKLNKERGWKNVTLIKTADETVIVVEDKD